ncbi:MAG: uncharacterized protein K0R72_139 [Clostridia bacterium]|jgi:uncharacterized protein|nr:uncharacterized protein [Clostridia bacterium]
MLRYNIIKKISILLVLLLFFTTGLVNVQAADALYSPTSQFFVNDFAGVLSDQTEQEIFNIGRNVQEQTTAQVVVVTVPNMNGDYIESYSNALFNKWGIGTKGKDNGILLILAKDERMIRIEVGYGLEGAINDAKAGRILDKYATTPLKANNYDKAILDSVKQIQGEIYTEYGIDAKVENPNYTSIDESYRDQEGKITIVIIGVFLFLMIITKGKILEVLFWFMMFFGNGGSGGGRFGGGGGHFGGGGGHSGGGGSSRGF